MGVTGLWSILHPCARPIKLETLNRKRLAVDASIWIYQFLKAVRDKEGNALRNSHVVGFFRRICKLLFFGIKPVFVFDGGAPVLKRQTVSERKRRREGRREDAVRTAGKLLAVQMQRRAEEEEAKRRDENQRGAQEEEAVPDEGLVYVDEIGMSQKERQQTRKFRKRDAYHLPDLDVSLNEMGGPNDPRIMSLEELQAYARQFEAGEDINVYDFSKIDYDSPFFMSLPASDRYNILNAARLRSRLRMGHSKEQLDSMFPDRMEFSRFQIERVRERNELTQRLMHINEGGDALFNGGGRVAGEKGREYVLVKNDGVEGGWALGVISDEGTKQETAIDVDKPAPIAKPEEEWEEEDEFEDVPIEGLNRLPKRPRLESHGEDAFSRPRKAFYQSRKAGARRKTKPRTESSSLFVAEDTLDDVEEEWEDVNGDPDLFGEANGEAEEEQDHAELQRAIAMSLNHHDEVDRAEAPLAGNEEDDDMLEMFQQTAAPESRPLPKGSGRAIANIVNRRAFDAAPESREVTSFGVPRLLSTENSVDLDDKEDEDTLDLQAALAESRKTKRKISPPPQRQAPSQKQKTTSSATDIANEAGFSGPLPFEKLDLGTSLLGKKKMQERSEEASGGFINPDLAHKEPKKPAEPLPPWFSEDPEEGIHKQRMLEKEELEKARQLRSQFRFDTRGEDHVLRQTSEVIDLEAEDEQPGPESHEVVDLDPVEDVQGDDHGNTADVPMSDTAETTRLESPVTEKNTLDEELAEAAITTGQSGVNGKVSASEHAQVSLPRKDVITNDEMNYDEEEELLDWSESEDEAEKDPHPAGSSPTKPIVEKDQRASRSPSADFEDVAIPDKPSSPHAALQAAVKDDETDGDPIASYEPGHEGLLPEDVELVEFDDFSDPEDEDLLRQLTLEAEEHARFASTLNNKTQAQNIADYEKELKQLRNQQKKDRRDADEVTHIMISECQQLLRLFGLPYVTAPMEAEAQCAELVRLGLVDGIVTDDSDCFLFGGTRIYKNMFNQAKFVECYLNSDLEKEFDLTRDKLIQIAHLLGSDYTEGLPGVGPVTALEILSEFPTLQDFKNWWSGVQMNSITKAEDADKPFRKKFRRNATKLFLPPSFPDVRVDIAYQQPEVDSDPEAFQWGVPDLDALRSFLMATIGWSQERTDEVLVPVIRDMNRRADEGTQSNITAFFDGGVGIGTAGMSKNNGQVDAFAPRKRAGESSKRMGSALTRMAEKAKRNRDPSGSHSAAADGEEVAAGQDNVTSKSPAKKTRSKTRRRKRVQSIDSGADSGSDVA